MVSLLKVQIEHNAFINGKLMDLLMVRGSTNTMDIFTVCM